MASMQRAQPPAPPGHPICRLPNDVFFIIIEDYLGLFDGVCLALTCRDLHERLAQVTGARALREDLTPLEFLAFLSTIARDLPNDYVCELCLRLHLADFRDGHARDVAAVGQASRWWRTAKPALEPPCCRASGEGRAGGQAKKQKGFVQSPSSRSSSRLLYTFFGSLSRSARRTPLAGLLHRDVQLALKRARMVQDLSSRPLGDNEDGVGLAAAVWDAASYAAGRFHGRHSYGSSSSSSRSTRRAHDRRWLQRAVQEALAPFTAEKQMVKMDSIYGKIKAPVHYAFAPRIVAAPAGGGPRFLLRTVVRTKTKAIENMPLSICPHQLINHRSWREWDKAKHANEDAAYPSYKYLRDISFTPGGPAGVSPSFRFDAAVTLVEREVTDHRGPGNLYRPDDHTGDDAQDGHDVGGSCVSCGTDFLVRGSAEWMEITVWQDFGPEGPPSDMAWQSHLPWLYLQAETTEGQYSMPNTWESGPTVVREPGSVCELYARAL